MIQQGGALEIGYMDLVNMVCSRRRGGNRARSSSDLDNMGCSLLRGGNRARSSSDNVNMGWIVHRSRKQGCGGTRARISCARDRGRIGHADLSSRVRRGGNIARSFSAFRVGRRRRYDLKRQRNVTRVFEHDPTGGGIGD